MALLKAKNGFSYKGSFVVLIAGFVCAVLIPQRGPPAYISSVVASNTYPGEEFLASQLIDYSTVESMQITNQWLLPDASLGSLTAQLSYPSIVDKLLILNTQNRDYRDRSTTRIIARLFYENKLVYKQESTIQPYPWWTHIKLDRAVLTDCLEIEVTAFQGLGGGLNEIRLRSANPFGLFGKVLGNLTFFLLIWVPILLFWKSLMGLTFWEKWLSLGGVGLVIYIMFWQFADQPSFPHGHEFVTHKERIAIYFWHVLRGDFFPIWSSSSGFGFGTPFPVFYHRVFYYVAIPGYLVFGTIKGAILYATVVFSMISVAGMIVLLKRIGINLYAAVLLGLCFPLLNYCYFNWTVRQAFCEYSAMCLVPWVLVWCHAVMHSLRPLSLFISGSFLFSFLYFTHSLTFFLSAFPVLTACCWRLFLNKNNRKAFITGLVATGILFFILTGPWMILQLVFAGNLDFKAVITQYQPQDYFQPLLNYLSDPVPMWGPNMRNNVKLNTAFVLAIIVAGIYLFIILVRKDVKKQLSWDWLWFSLVFLWYVFLQSRLSLPVYQHVPGFKYIQFPWRSLTYLTPLLIVLVALLLRTLNQSVNDFRVSRIGSQILFITTIAFTPYQKNITREWYPGKLFEVVESADKGTNPFYHGDYWPVMTYQEIQQRRHQLVSISPRVTTRVWNTDYYQLKRRDPHVFEDLEYNYKLTVSLPCTVILPATYSGFEIVELKANKGKWQILDTFRTRDDFRIHFNCEPGEYELRLRLPTLARLLL